MIVDITIHLDVRGMGLYSSCRCGGYDGMDNIPGNIIIDED